MSEEMNNKNVSNINKIKAKKGFWEMKELFGGKKTIGSQKSKILAASRGREKVPVNVLWSELGRPPQGQ